MADQGPAPTDAEHEAAMRQLQADAAEAVALVRKANRIAQKWDDDELTHLRAANKILRAECARWRAAAIRLGHKGYLTDAE